MKTEVYDDLVRRLHDEEGYSWIRAQRKADDLILEE